MKRKNNLLDFSEQNFFIGMDVHKKQWTVTIRSNEMELKHFSIDPKPDGLVTYLEKNYPKGNYYSVYEAGFCGYWIHRRLECLGVKNKIVNAADVPTTDKEKKQKSDKVDSRKLSKCLEKGDFERGVFIPTEEQQAFRSFSRLRFQLIKRYTQIKLRIKSHLHFIGIEIPSKNEISQWSNNFIKWLKEVKLPDKKYRITLDYQIVELTHIRGRILEVLQQIRKDFKTNEILRLLKTVPGIGYITAYVLYAEIMDINRFNKFDNLASNVGLIPSTKDSGETEIVRGITQRANKNLRPLIIESAWMAIRKDPALTSAYNKLLKSKNGSQAIIKIAKKLLNRIRFVWKNKQEYVLATVE